MTVPDTSSPGAPPVHPPVSPARDAAEALAFTVHDAPPPERDLADAQGRRGGRVTMLAILATCAAPVLLSYFLYFVVRPHLHTSNYAELVPQRPLPDALPLRTLDGQPVRPAALRGQWLLVVVAPAECGPACEKRLYLQRQLREMTGKERDRIDKVWLVDGEGAPPAPLLAAITAAPATTVLRTDRAALQQWLAPAAGHALEDHLYMVDPMGNWMMRAPVDPDPKKLRKDLERLLSASASWDLPGREPSVLAPSSLPSNPPSSPR